MADYSKLCDLAQYEIEDLQAAGINPTPAEIVELNALAWGIRSTANEMTLAKGTPSTCGNVMLWPLTIEAGEWYNKFGCVIKGMEVEALAYAMAHCYADGNPFVLTNPRKTIKAWSKTIKATTRTLKTAMDDVLVQMESPEMPPREDDRTFTIGELAAKLSIYTGIPPDYWERQCSIWYGAKMLHFAMEKHNESGKQLESDPIVRATVALGWCVEKIKKSREVNNG
jgi:hypothetical protein